MPLATRHRLATTLLLLLIPALLVLAPAPADAQPSPTWDHYKVYRVAPVEVVPHPLLRLIDQFGIWDHEVLQLEKFQNPTVKEHAGQTFPINDFNLHYSWWRLTDSPFSAAVSVSNQFGDQTLQVGPGQYLLNPALKNMSGPLPIENHYKCYQCQGAPVNASITLTDQFDAFLTVAADPAYLCAPVWKGIVDGPSYPIIEPDQHYVCYFVNPQDPQVFSAFFSDQFVLDQNIQLTPGEMICVPSEKVVATPTQERTWGRLKILYR